MKIAVFYNLPPGGAKRVLFEEVKNLSKKHELHLFEFTSTDEVFLDLKPFCKSIKPYPFQLKSELPSILKRLHMDYQNFVSLKKIHQEIAADIDKGRFDVCLVHPDKLTQAPFLLRYLKTPSAYYCHELLRIAYEKELAFKGSFPNSVYEALTRKIRKDVDFNNARAARQILTNSKYTKAKIKKAYRKNAIVCYPAVDAKVFNSMKHAGQTERQLLFIGEKENISGYNLVKKVLKHFPSKYSFKLKIVNFKSRKPRLTDDRLVAEYTKSLVTFCAHYNEPFGMVLLESMACETPVLAVNEGGYRETVVDGKTGYLLRRDPKVFAEKIMQLIKNPNLVKKMGKAGRKHVINNFTWKKHNNVLEKELLKLVK